MADKPLLELVNVSKIYSSPSGQDAAVLRNISLALSAGQSLAIVGPSGSGKSTLLNLIGLLDSPTEGQVLLDGVDISRLDETRLAELRNWRLGFVFQMHHLLPQLTVLENVLVPTLAGGPADGEAPDRARRLLGRVGLESRMHYRPGELSGGERQRVAVVRALIRRPGLLLADEPTGSLDHASAVNLGQLLVELNAEEGVTLVVVTHSMELAGRMGIVLRLCDGKLTPAPREAQAS